MENSRSIQARLTDVAQPDAAVTMQKQGVESAPSILEVAEELVTLYREGRYLEALDRLYADDVVSTEAVAPPGGPRTARGKAIVRDRHTTWLERREFHTTAIDGPYLDGGGRFAMRMRFDLTDKASGERRAFEEVALYEVDAGKIVREDFLYGSAWV